MTDDNKPGAPKDSHYARLRRAHRDTKAGAQRPARRESARDSGEPVPDGFVRLYGLHAVRAAIANPRRKIGRLLITRNAAQRIGIDDPATLPFDADIVEPKAIDKMLGSDAVHQGAMLEARPLTPKRLGDLREQPLVLVLDQVTDPHNVGAIMRSAVAFGAGALIATARHSPNETGVLAKAASGALEEIDHIEVRNLASAIEELHGLGFLTIGLDSDGPAQLENTFSGERIALVLGAEGKGLRQKTGETVGALARLDLPGPIRSLNVSNAAAVAMYAARRYLDR